MKKGIDISVYQGSVNFKALKDKVDFVIIRAGYGQNNIDKRFVEYITGCNKYKIPCGVYWFSYALDADMARREAEYCINAIRDYIVEFPVAFDYEYDSYNYAVKQGRKPSRTDMVNIARAFLERVEELGYYAINYTNPNFLNRGFSELTKRFDTWLAQWGVSNPSSECGIWQYSAKGQLNGIDGDVDMDISYNDYPIIIKNLGLNNLGGHKVEIPDKIDSFYILAKTYYEKAIDVVEGFYGTGSERMKLLKEEGYDAEIVQKIVNWILG